MLFPISPFVNVMPSQSRGRFSKTNATIIATQLKSIKFAKSTFGTVKSISILLARIAHNLRQMMCRNGMHLIYGNRIMSDIFRNNSASRQYTALYESLGWQNR